MGGNFLFRYMMELNHDPIPFCDIFNNLLSLFIGLFMLYFLLSIIIPHMYSLLNFLQLRLIWFSYNEIQIFVHTLALTKYPFFYKNVKFIVKYIIWYTFFKTFTIHIKSLIYCEFTHQIVYFTSIIKSIMWINGCFWLAGFMN